MVSPKRPTKREDFVIFVNMLNLPSIAFFLAQEENFPSQEPKESSLILVKIGLTDSKLQNYFLIQAQDTLLCPQVV